MTSLPANQHLLAFNSCTVDLRTGGKLPHAPAHLITRSIAAEYESNQPGPDVFLNFVNNAFGEDLIDEIRAYTSMYLDPTAPYGKFVHILGPSGSGKGTLARFWGDMFGEGQYKSGDFSCLSNADKRHQYLSGVALFAVFDVGGYVQGLKPFYELVDNGPMSGRALFSSVTYNRLWNTRFVVCSVNHLNIEDAGDGWDRRCLVLPTKERQGEEDPNLRTKLAEVKSQVISWALAMPREERDRILLRKSTNERVQNAKLDASIHGDPIRAFIDLCYRPSTRGSTVQNCELYDQFTAFAKAHGYQSPGSTKFINRLKDVLPKHRVDRHKYKGEWVSAYWINMEPLPGVFVDVSESSDYDNSPKLDPILTCVKSRCKEGGLIAFQEFGIPQREKTQNQPTPTSPPVLPVLPVPIAENGDSTGVSVGQAISSAVPVPEVVPNNVPVPTQQADRTSTLSGTATTSILPVPPETSKYQGFQENGTGRTGWTVRGVGEVELQLSLLGVDQPAVLETHVVNEVVQLSGRSTQSDLNSESLTEEADTVEVDNSTTTEFKVGDLVDWDEAHAGSMKHYNPFRIMGIEGDRASLDRGYSFPVPLNQLRHHQEAKHEDLF